MLPSHLYADLQERALLLSGTPAARAVELYTAHINVPSLLMNHLGMNLNSHDGITEVSVCLFFFLSYEFTHMHMQKHV